MEQLVKATIEQKVLDIKEYMTMGLSKDKAIEIVKSESCLGAKAWEQVLNQI